MKKILILTLLLTTAITAFSKKVKFAVNMTGQTLLSTGIHVTGDFQTAAGFSGGDWMSNTTPLTQETADTNIYSIVVDIPAFSKYEYKFVNGDQFYEAEFVPVESRVGYNFSDSRWIYVDSTANDTSFVGAIMFGGNAPAGYHLLRLKVDLSNEASIDPAGVHFAGSFQGWNPSKNIMYKLNDTLDEVIAYIDTNTISVQFKYINGNTAAGYETVPGSCAVSSNREVFIPKDTVLNIVCFSSCSVCIPAGIAENGAGEKLKLYPNPAADFTTLEFENNDERNISILNVLGSKMRSYEKHNGTTLRIEKNELHAGVYFITIRNSENKISTTKLIIQ
jgi:type IX secretion system substrate protein